MRLILPANQQMHNGFRPYGDPGGRHSGQDYGWASGDVVKAAADGVVVSAYGGGGYNGGWGNRIIVEHAPGVRTTYNHLAPGTLTVKAGDRVSAGQKLGIMGTTGKVTGKHLHFELYLAGVRVDPAPYFSTALPGTAAAPAVAASDGPFVDLPEWWYSYGSAADARAGRYKAGVGIGPGRFRVRGSENGALRVETARGDVWLHPKAAALVTGGSVPAAASLVGRELNLNSWYWYRSAAEARAMRNPQGKGKGQILLQGRGYFVLAEDGGALQVHSRSMGTVWLHPDAAARVI